MIGQPIADLEKVTEVPSGSLYPVAMGDGSGTKAVTQETLTKEVGKGLKVGNLAELQTENKNNLVAAINEAAQSGGGGAAVDILDTKEEIEANTESGKAAGAQAVKEMFGAINDNLNGNILTYNESEDAYYIQHGADAVPKKLGSGTFKHYWKYGNVTTGSEMEIGFEPLLIFIHNGYKYAIISETYFLCRRDNANAEMEIVYNNYNKNPVIEIDGTKINIVTIGDCKTGTTASMHILCIG